MVALIPVGVLALFGLLAAARARQGVPQPPPRRAPPPPPRQLERLQRRPAPRAAPPRPVVRVATPAPRRIAVQLPPPITVPRPAPRLVPLPVVNAPALLVRVPTKVAPLPPVPTRDEIRCIVAPCGPGDLYQPAPIVVPRMKPAPVKVEVPRMKPAPVKALPPPPAPEPAPPPPAPAPAPAPAQDGLRPRAAAERLYVYASMKIRSGQAAQLGSRGAPNADVLAFQKAMRLIAADGIYGPKTRARGKELIGKDFPVRRSVAVSKAVAPDPPAPDPTADPLPVKSAEDLTYSSTGAPKLVTAPPAAFPGREIPLTRSPRDAALALLAHIQSGGARGTRNNRSEVVRLAQADMGALTADGIYGPNTRRRGKALTGKSFPPR